MTFDEIRIELAKRGFAGRAADGAALVLSEGAGVVAAAKQQGVTPSAVSRVLSKNAAVCPCCGQRTRSVS